jgi:hypothetical protein
MTDSLLGCYRELHAWLTPRPRAELFIVDLDKRRG